jgi:ABC-type cobalamin transport system ATPase subunit
MTTTDVLVDDTDIDVPIDDCDEGERRALRLAGLLREVAAHNPAYAQLLLDELVESLDQATDGKFREYVRAVNRSLAAHGE